MGNVINRNVSIDLFKCVSMIMVIILHVLGHGGILSNLTEGSKQSYILWLLEIFCMCAVNCFAIISGYLLISKIPNYRRIINLWLQVVFYCILIGILIIIFFPNISSSLGKRNILIQSVFPLLNDQCGYFTCYFLLSMFMPFLNKFLKKLSHKEFKKLVILMFICFSIMPVLSGNDLFGTENGYAAIWLFVMYIYGAYIKLFYDISNICPSKFLIGYIITSTLAWFFKFFSSNILHTTSFLSNSDMFIVYISPFIVLSSVFLLLFFINIRISNDLIKRIICFASSGSFAVILIHDHPIVRDYFMNDSFIYLLKSSIYLIVLKIFGYGFLIFTICVVIDAIRRLVFDMFNINKLGIKILNLSNKIYDNLMNHLIS